MIFLIISIVVMKKANDLTPTYKIPVFLGSMINDLVSLGVTVILNYVVELSLGAFATAFSTESKRISADAETFTSLGKGLEQESLVQTGKNIAEQANIFDQISTSISDFSGAFGLSAVSLTLVTYIVARTAYFIYLRVDRK
jgi:hypothetical protein